jgi:hypothetical protein
MPAPTIVKPQLLTDPGFLYYAPIGTTLPTNTVTGSVFTDVWTAPWVWLGVTTSGSVWHYNITTAAIQGAEILDDLAYRTTGRTASIDFMLESYTATNLALAMNGATKTVTGATTTTMTSINPPLPGQETRCMIGFESLDATVRMIAYQCINSGDIAQTFAKAPSHADIAFHLNLEIPTSPVVPFTTFTAGLARA